jgi:hypothetical protein
MDKPMMDYAAVALGNCLWVLYFTGWNNEWHHAVGVRARVPSTSIFYRSQRLKHPDNSTRISAESAELVYGGEPVWYPRLGDPAQH